MPRRCTVCAHPERETIDEHLVDGLPNRRIATRYGVKEQAIRRHRDTHLPDRLAKAEAAEAVAADDLLGRLRALNRETADVLREAKAAKNQDLRLRAITRAEKQLELEARLLGDLIENQTTINIAVLPEWLTVRAAILDALVPHPVARVAVAERLPTLASGQ